MSKMKNMAVAVFAVAGLSGCASTQVAGLASEDQASMRAVEKQAVEHKVSRALPSYGSMGGYRYRRFAAVAAAS